MSADVRPGKTSESGTASAKSVKFGPESEDRDSDGEGSPVEKKRSTVKFKEKDDGEVAVSFISSYAPDDDDPDGEGPEAYKYDPEEKGETWDIYKQRSVMENQSKRKSEDAVLIKAKADAAIRAQAVAEAAASATACFQQEASVGRKTRGRTAIVATAGVSLPTEEELLRRTTAGDDDEDEEDSDEDEAKQQDSMKSQEVKEDPKDAETGPTEAAKVDESPQSTATPAAEPTASASSTQLPAANGYTAPEPPPQVPAPAPVPEPPVAATESQKAPVPNLLVDGASADPPDPVPTPVAPGATYPLAELQNGCPEGVPPNSKEDYLSDADFLLAMKMPRADYAKLPQWKKQNAKKAAKIF